MIFKETLWVALISTRHLPVNARPFFRPISTQILIRHPPDERPMFSLPSTLKPNVLFSHEEKRAAAKPATGEGMDKSTLVHTQIQIIIIHFLRSSFSPIPNG
jgi:hypothetical protein